MIVTPMSDETLLTAARRVVRFFNIDLNQGGLVTVETQHAVEVLDQQVRREAKRLKEAENDSNRDANK